MPLIPSQNPWATAAGVADSSGNQLAETLMRLPLMRQQIQQGVLHNQLLQGQVTNQPLLFQGQRDLNQARVGQYNAMAGANTARAGLYKAHGDVYQANADTVNNQNTGIAALQETLKNATPYLSSGQQLPPELQAQITSGIVRLPPGDIKNLVDAATQSLRFSNPSLMGDPRVQLSPAAAARGVNVTTGAANFPPGGGEPVRGDIKLGANQAAYDPTGGLLADNTKPGNGPKSSALEAAVFKALTVDGQLTPQQAAAAVPNMIAAMHGTNTPPASANANALQAPQGTNSVPNKKFTWTPQGLVPQN